MSDIQTKPTSQMPPQDSSSPPTRRQAIRLLLAAVIGGSFLALAGMTLTGTVIALIIATPLLVLLSPILVPAALVLSLVATGFVFSGGCVVAAMAMMAWIYNYAAGKHPPGSDQLDYYRTKIANKARDVKERAKEVANQTPAPAPAPAAVQA